MSTYIPQFDPASPPPANATQMVCPLANGGWVFLVNESAIGLSIKHPVSSEQWLVPAYSMRMKRVLHATAVLTWAPQYVVQTGQTPVSLLTGEAYDPAEYDGAEFLIALPRLVNVGNQTSSGTVQNIINDGNAAGTTVIESTPTGQAGSSFSRTNDGAGFEKVLSANVLRTILNVTRGDTGVTKAVIMLGDSNDPSITTFYGQVGAGSTVPATTLGAGAIPAGVTLPAGQLSAGTIPAGVTIPAGQVTGGITTAQKLIGASQTDGVTATDDGTSARLVPTATTQRDTILQYVNGSNVATDGPRVIRASTNGGNTAGQLQHSASSNNYGIISTFSGTGAGTYAHGESAKTPRTVLFITTQANSTQTVGYDTLGSTNVDLNMPNAWPFTAAAILS